MSQQLGPSTTSSHHLTFRPYGKTRCPNQGIPNDLICAFGEFLGTGMFLFMALGGSNFVGSRSIVVIWVNSSHNWYSRGSSILLHCRLASLSFYFEDSLQGLALIIVALLFVKASGSKFNPAISLSLFLVGSIHLTRTGKSLSLSI
jgi:aquaporin rerated protein, other eukaryote